MSLTKFLVSFSIFFFLLGAFFYLRSYLFVKNNSKEKETLKKIKKELNKKTKTTNEEKEKIKKEIFDLEIRENEVEIKKREINSAKEKLVALLQENATLPINEETKPILISLLTENLEKELKEFSEKKIIETKKNLKKTVTEIVCSAIERYGSYFDNESVNESIIVEKQDVVSKIIGKDGRNINFFRRITGTDLIIDEEKKGMWRLKISSFNSLRKELARQTLEGLILKDKISPTWIEEYYQEKVKETNSYIRELAKKTLDEMEITGVHAEMVFLLGKLRFRSSYGQNVLKHSVEVAKLAGIMANELGLDKTLAQRAGLFHDIGKAVDDEHEFSHVINGIKLAKTYNEPSEVINAIASHHHDEKVNNFYSYLVIAADRISASRPGARSNQLENYLKRMKEIEKIAGEFSGVKKSYAFQAGREIWVIVDPEKLNESETWELSLEIKKRIKKTTVIPGGVTINVIREKRFTQSI